MRIQHNIAAMNSLRQLTGNNSAVSKSLEKLSSGYRINRAGDDAAGLAISEKMRAQIRGLTMASKNAQDGISLVQTAEGALTETHSILQRMRELAVQASNGIYANEDREQTQLEITALKTEIDRISTATTFNGIDLLNGTQSDNGAWKAMQGEEGLATKIGDAIGAAMVEAENKVNTDNATHATDKSFEVKTTPGVVGDLDGDPAVPGTLTIDFTGITNVEKGDTLVIGNTKYEFVAEWNDPDEVMYDPTAVKVRVGADLANTLANLKGIIRDSAGYTDKGANAPTGYGEVAAVDGNKIVITAKTEGDSQALASAVFTTKANTTEVSVDYDAFVPATAPMAIPVNAKASVKLDFGTQLIDAGSTFNFAGGQYKLYTNATDAAANGGINIGATVAEQKEALNDLMMDHFTAKGFKAELASDGTLTVMHQSSISEAAAAALFGTVSLDSNYTAKTFGDAEKAAVYTKVYKDLSAEDKAALKGYGVNSLDADWKAKLETGVRAQENGVVFQIGANGEGDQRVEIEIGDMGAEALGIDKVDLTTQEGAIAAIDVIDEAINSVSAQRAELGALQNRLEHTINNLDTNNENLTASESRIRDVDMAAEMMKYTQNNVLVQAAQSMLAQANQQPQSVLSLLQ